jgi:hypothetical protein
MQIRNWKGSFQRLFCLPGVDQPGDFLYLLLLAFCYGAYFLLLTVAMYLPGKVVESEEFLIYVQGWLTVPVLTLLAVLGVRAFKQRFFTGAEYFYPVLLGINLLSGIIFTTAINLTWQQTKSFTILWVPVIAAAVLFAAFQIFGLWLLRNSRERLASKMTPRQIQWLNRALPLGLGLFFINFMGIFATFPAFKTPLVPIILAAMAGLVINLRSFSFGASDKRSAHWVGDVLALTLIGLLCFDPKFTVEFISQNFYLGATNALLHGGTMLVNVYSQYGILDIELLSLFFQILHVSITYQLFSMLNGVLCMLQFAMIYWILRILLKSQGYAFLGLVVVSVLNLFATLGIFQSSPSIGPLRFGLAYLMLGLIILRLKFPGRRRSLLVLEYALLGLTSIWSFETFIYCAAIFAGCRIYQSLLEGHSFKNFMRQILLKAGGALLSILLFQIGQALFTFIRAGQWPNWGIYLHYLYRYSVGGVGTLPVDPWSAWFIMAAIYFMAIVSILIRWAAGHHLDGSLEAQAMLYTSLMGIAIFTYFVGRSHPNNLLHICVPAVIIALSGFQALTRIDLKEYAGFIRSSTYVCFTGLALIVFIYFPNITSKLPNTAFPTLQAILGQGEKFDFRGFFTQEKAALIIPRVDSLQTTEAVDLIKKYASDQPRVTVFLIPKGTTPAIIAARKAQSFPISEPVQDSLSGEIVRSIMDSPTPQQNGDVIFLASNPENLSMKSANSECYVANRTSEQCMELQINLVQQLCSHFGFDEIEKTPNGVSAIRLTPPASGTSDYCQRLNSFVSSQGN